MEMARQERENGVCWRRGKEKLTNCINQDVPYESRDGSLSRPEQENASGPPYKSITGQSMVYLIQFVFIVMIADACEPIRYVCGYDSRAPVGDPWAEGGAEGQTQGMDCDMRGEPLLCWGSYDRRG